MTKNRLEKLCSWSISVVRMRISMIGNTAKTDFRGLRGFLGRTADFDLKFGRQLRLKVCELLLQAADNRVGLRIV